MLWIWYKGWQDRPSSKILQAMWIPVWFITRLVLLICVLIGSLLSDLFNKDQQTGPPD
jgi:hypothetical protein